MVLICILLRVIREELDEYEGKRISDNGVKNGITTSKDMRSLVSMLEDFYIPIVS